MVVSKCSEVEELEIEVETFGHTHDIHVSLLSNLVDQKSLFSLQTILCVHVLTGLHLFFLARLPL